MESVELDPASSFKSWQEQRLRTVRYDAVRSTIFARQMGVVQRTYHFERNEDEPLAIRFCSGIVYKGAVGHLVWILGYADVDHEVLIGIEPSYIFERTACMVTQRVVNWGGQGIVDLMAICEVALGPLSDILNLRLERFLLPSEISQSPARHYLSVDHLQHSRVIIQTLNQTLEKLEVTVRHYCQPYWAAYEYWSGKVLFELNTFIYPTQRIYTTAELAELGVGDLIRLQQTRYAEGFYRLRGGLQFKGRTFNSKRYEVFLEMNEDDTRLKFGHHSLEDTPADEVVSTEAMLPPHETIELEIMAGSTKILFSELCSIQEGSLIEIRNHALPEVTLSVMGSPILEGELVYFQDQIMVQVTKRLG